MLDKPGIEFIVAFLRGRRDPVSGFLQQDLGLVRALVPERQVGQHQVAHQVAMAEEGLAGVAAPVAVEQRRGIYQSRSRGLWLNSPETRGFYLALAGTVVCLAAGLVASSWAARLLIPSALAVTAVGLGPTVISQTDAAFDEGRALLANELNTIDVIDRFGASVVEGA